MHHREPAGVRTEPAYGYRRRPGVTLDSGRCVVWWAPLVAAHAIDHAVLDEVETARARNLRRADDQRRSLLGAALLRLAVEELTGRPAGRVLVDRRCDACDRPHGRPRLPGTELFASVSHAGDWVAVALTGAGQVGVDVERVIAIDIDALAPVVVGQLIMTGRLTLNDFFVYWTRKESVLKATGDGLAVRIAEIAVKGPAEPAALLAYPGRPDMHAQMADLAPGTGHVAALTVLSDQPVQVDERDASELLLRHSPGT